MKAYVCAEVAYLELGSADAFGALVGLFMAARFLASVCGMECRRQHGNAAGSMCRRTLWAVPVLRFTTPTEAANTPANSSAQFSRDFLRH